jgi:hypothetical protein
MGNSELVREASILLNIQENPMMAETRGVILERMKHVLG